MQNNVVYYRNYYNWISFLDNVQQLMTAQELLKSEIASIQNLIKEQLSVFKSTLTSHNQIISDVRVLLKSLAKVSINLL